MKSKRRLRIALIVAVVAVVALLAVFAPVLARLDYGSLPRRAAWQRPDRVIQTLGLRPGDRVADIGAGDGYFTFRLADAVGAGGRVYAVEVDEKLVRNLRQEVESRGYENIEVVLAAPDDPGLPDGEIDLAFFCDVYHHIDDRVSYFDRLRRDLEPGGRVVLVEVKGQPPFRWLTPPGHETREESVLEEMGSAHYRLVREDDFLPVQNLFIFTPAPASEGNRTF